MSPPQEPAPTAPPGLGYLPDGDQAPPSRLRRWRWPLLGAAVAVVLAVAVTGVVLVVSHWSGRPATGDTALTLRASAAAGGAPAPATLDATRRVLLARMKAAKVTRPTVTILGTDTLLVTVAPVDSDRVRTFVAAGSLTFRKVVGTVTDQPVAATPPGCPAGGGVGTDPTAALAAVKARLGALYDRAAAIQDPAQAEFQTYAPFGALSCAEVTALPERLQYMVPTVSCVQLNGRVPGVVAADPDHGVTACDAEHKKYRLDVAKVGNTDVASAVAGYQSDAGGWTVTLKFTGPGQARWTALTREAVAAGPGTTSIAMVLDNQVLTAPVIEEAIAGDAVISGSFDRKQAEAIAADVQFGVLPVTLTTIAIQRVR